MIPTAALCLTDYSPLTMDKAVLDFPPNFFQLDAAVVLGGRYLNGSGYFKFGCVGFGTVVAAQEAALKSVYEISIQGEGARFAERRQITLVQLDAQNATRTYAAVREALGRPALK